MSGQFKNSIGHWFSCSLNTFFFLPTSCPSFTFTLNLDAELLITCFFSRGLGRRDFLTFLIVLNFRAELLNEVWDSSLSKWGWFIAKLFLYLFRRFLSPSFCIFYKYIYSILTTILLVFPSKRHLSYTLQRSSLCNITTVSIWSLRFSFHLFHSYKQWTNGARYQTILKVSFWNSTPN